MLPELFLTFMKIGMFTFGGGYAMISVVENACVEDKHWITHDDMMNITVIAESTPGPIAINCATFVGYKKQSYRCRSRNGRNDPPVFSDHLPGRKIFGQLSGDQLDRTRL